MAKLQNNSHKNNIKSKVKRQKSKGEISQKSKVELRQKSKVELSQKSKVKSQGGEGNKVSSTLDF
ncbi:MAG: hypothetical protein LIP03_10625 [Bacteroidales bacterium]|nr:hypothetical protein [Bacteroidales bacterium]